MSSSLLSPLQLVELGSRITEHRAEELGLVSLIDDARIVSGILMDAVAGAAAPLGVSQSALEEALLGGTWYGVNRWARDDPRRDPHSYEQIPLPPPRSVLRGKKERAGSKRWYAIVIRSGEVLLLQDPYRGKRKQDRTYGSFTGLARAAGYEGQAKAFWKELGRYPEGARL